jgi:sec-independent protein translocase protein TatA
VAFGIILQSVPARALHEAGHWTDFVRGLPRFLSFPDVEVDMPFGLGFGELVLIFGVLLLLFGAKRLPELAGGMGKGIRDFKRAINGLDEQSIQANAQQNYLEQAPAAPVQVPAATAVPAQPVPAQAEKTTV